MPTRPTETPRVDSSKSFDALRQKFSTPESQAKIEAAKEWTKKPNNERTSSIQKKLESQGYSLNG